MTGDILIEISSRMEAALEIIREYGGIDGAHHKQWVLDQVVRTLTAEGYGQWVAKHNAGEDGSETYKWSEGTPP